MKALTILSRKASGFSRVFNSKTLVVFAASLSFLLLFSCRTVGEDLAETEPPTDVHPPMGVQKCGAFVAPGKWKEFACQNLGATPGKNPFEPIAENHGAKYQWGAFKDEAGRYISQDNYQAMPLGSYIPGWEKYTKTLDENTKPDNSWTTNNPCKAELGDGWRVPTKDEWQGVITNNKATPVKVNGIAQGAMYGDKLFLPISSSISPQGQTGQGIGIGDYWSSTPHKDFAYYTNYHNMAYHLLFANTDSGPVVGIISYVDMANQSRLNGLSIRCIKD